MIQLDKNDSCVEIGYLNRRHEPTLPARYFPLSSYKKGLLAITNSLLGFYGQDA